MRGKRIPLEKPVYLCEECGSKERKVNVVGGRVLCHEYRAKQKALGKRVRKCPDGKCRFLTDEEFNNLKDGLR